MKIDPLSLFGILTAFAAIIGGNWLEGGHLGSLINGPAIVIVFGGTLGATLLQTPVPVFLHAMRLAGQVFIMPSHNHQGTIRKIIAWSETARRAGLLGLEDVLEQEKDPFMRKGMQLLVDGSAPSVIRNVLEMELDSHEQAEILASKVFEGMGGYAPTLGILGAVMGLIQVMQHLADPSKLGTGIATAFVATIYGVGLANLFLLPFASKLKTLSLRRAQFRELMVEGIVAVAGGENPRNIELKLMGFVSE